MRKTIAFLILPFLIGCSASMVSTRGDSQSVYAPVNESSLHGGTIRYLTAGANWVVSKRRRDAYRQMHGKCNGDYKIVREYYSNDSGAIVPVGGVAIAASDPWQYIDFQCVD